MAPRHYLILLGLVGLFAPFGVACSGPEPTPSSTTAPEAGATPDMTTNSTPPFPEELTATQIPAPTPVPPSGSFSVDLESGNAPLMVEFLQPTGLAVDSSGHVYVTDFQNHRIQKFDSDGRFVLNWGSFGGDAGLFNGPHGIAIDPQDNVYVTDRMNNRIQKFTSDGLFITQWGSFGSGEGRFNSPTGIAVDASGTVYVVEKGDNNAEGGHRVQIFTSGGAFITEWGSYGSGLGRFNDPSDVAVDSLGNVYVVDTRNNRIQKFTEVGVFLTAWGSEGNGNGQFFRPFGLTIDSSDRVIVADNRNFRSRCSSLNGRGQGLQPRPQR